MKVLVFSAHPDDETLGAGGTISKHVKNGDEVTLCVVTIAYEPKWTKEMIERARKEVLDVKEILGITEIEFLNLPTAKLDTIPKIEINDKVRKIINKIQPEIVYTPYLGDIHNDHKIVFESVLLATRPIKDCPVKKVLAFEILSSTEWGALSNSNIFNPNVFVNITETLPIKIKALKAYGQELQYWPHPRSIEATEILAKYRGCTVGMDAAEAFMLIRENIE